MTNLALYQIAENYRDAVEALSDMDLPVEAVQDTLDAIQGELQVKATNVVKFAENLEALAEQIKLAEKKMAHRRKVIENRVESIRNYIKSCMETNKITSIECPEFKISIKKNPPKVLVLDETKIPDECFREPPPPPPREPDKILIGELLKAGVDVEWARLEKGTRLSID